MRPGTASASHWAAQGLVEPVSGGQVDGLQHAVDGPTDSRAVAALQPRREIEVAGPLLESRVRLVLAVRCALVGQGGGGHRRRSGGPLQGGLALGRPRGQRRRWRRRGQDDEGKGTGSARPRRADRSTRSPMPARSSSALVAPGGRRLVGPGLAVQRDDQMIAGPGAGHVEQPDPLVEAICSSMGAHSRYSWRGHVLPELVPDAPAAGRREHHLGRGRPPLGHGRHARHDGDGELEALGAVDGHDAHGVVVALGQDGLGHPGPLGRLRLHPAQVLAEVPAGGLAPGPGLVDDEAQPAPHVAGPSLGEARAPGPAGRRRCGRAARRAPASGAGRRASAGRRGRRRTGSSIGDGVGLVGQVAPTPLPFGLEAEQVVVATGQQRRPQGGHDAEVVGGVVDGPQHHEQVAHGPAGVDEGARLGPEGDARPGRRRPPGKAARCGPGRGR